MQASLSLSRATVLVACLVAALPSQAATAANGANLNGVSMNGTSFNGLSLNGLSLNGAALDGLAAVPTAGRAKPARTPS